MPGMHEIEYEIHGDDLQFVEVLLDPTLLFVELQELWLARALVYLTLGVQVSGQRRHELRENHGRSLRGAPDYVASSISAIDQRAIA